MKLIRKIKTIKTPSCSKCKNCRVTITGDFMCSSPSHIDFIEKTKCVRIKEAHAFVVRGTKYCKFESKEQ